MSKSKVQFCEAGSCYCQVCPKLCLIVMYVKNSDLFTHRIERKNRPGAQVSESLAGYLRKATEERVGREKKRKQDLKKLAEEVFGGIKKNPMDKKRAKEWIKQIRKDRKLEDKHLDEKWVQTLKK